MDAELKSKWIQALRSGKYTQARSQLTDGASYCCLGVLCKVIGLDFNKSGEPITDRWDGGYTSILPLTAKQADELWHRNDGVDGHEQHSFKEIAQYIEKNL